MRIVGSKEEREEVRELKPQPNRASPQRHRRTLKVNHDDLVNRSTIDKKGLYFDH